MQRCNNLTPLQRDNFVKVLTIFEVSSTGLSFHQLCSLARLALATATTTAERACLAFLRLRTPTDFSETVSLLDCPVELSPVAQMLTRLVPSLPCACHSFVPKIVGFSGPFWPKSDRLQPTVPADKWTEHSTVFQRTFRDFPGRPIANRQQQAGMSMLADCTRGHRDGP